MFYKVDIFFRNVHHLSDGRFAAGIWAKWASFNFDKDSEHYISPVDVAEIMGWMSGPTIVAEFGFNNSLDNIMEVTKLLNIDSIAIPHALYSDSLKNQFREIIITDRKTSDFHYFTEEMDQNKNAIIYPKLNPSGAEDILKAGVKNIFIEGLQEDKPGTADYEELSAYMELLEI